MKKQNFPLFLRINRLALCLAATLSLAFGSLHAQTVKRDSQNYTTLTEKRQKRDKQGELAMWKKDLLSKYKYEKDFLRGNIVQKITLSYSTASTKYTFKITTSKGYESNVYADFETLKEAVLKRIEEVAKETEEKNKEKEKKRIENAGTTTDKELEAHNIEKREELRKFYTGLKKKGDDFGVFLSRTTCMTKSKEAIDAILGVSFTSVRTPEGAIKDTYTLRVKANEKVHMVEKSYKARVNESKFSDFASLEQAVCNTFPSKCMGIPGMLSLDPRLLADIMELEELESKSDKIKALLRIAKRTNLENSLVTFDAIAAVTPRSLSEEHSIKQEGDHWMPVTIHPNMRLFEYIYSDGNGFTPQESDSIAKAFLMALFKSAREQRMYVGISSRIEILLKEVKRGVPGVYPKDRGRTYHSYRNVPNAHDSAKGIELYFWDVLRRTSKMQSSSAYAHVRLNSRLQGPNTQGQIGECWLVAASNAIINHPKGKKIMEKIITKDKNGNAKVTLHDTLSADGKAFEYTVTKQDLAGLDYLSKGDMDVRAVEIAVMFHLCELYAQRIHGGDPAVALMLLLNKPQSSGSRNGSDPLDNGVQTFSNYGSSNENEIKKVLLKHGGNPDVIMTIAGARFDGKCRVLKTQKMISLIPSHAYSIRKVNGNLVYFVNPHKPTELLSMTIDSMSYEFRALTLCKL